MNPICCGVVALAVLVLVLHATLPALAATAKESNYRGWKTLALDNGLIEVQIAPAIGGRIVQLKLTGFEYLWVNDQLAGTVPPASGVGPNGEWLNFGGDKLWPAPQGWERDDQWHGPPDPVLDGSAHAATVLAKTGSPVSIQLTSQKDKRSGIQFSRVVKVFDNAAHVSIDSTMTNTDTRPRRWGIWEVTQHNVANRQRAGYNKNMSAYCPVNPKSIHRDGFYILFGLVNNPEFRVDPNTGMMKVHYQRRVGKIGMDCSAGWLAVVNGTDGYVFVERFRYYPDKPYPDESSVEFWTHGPGQWVQGDQVLEMKDDPVECPYFMESEVLSPFAELKPGESYSFHLDWYAAKISGNYPVLDCTNVGVTCEPFAAKAGGGTLTLSGRFGVFYPGTSRAIFLDADDREIGKADLRLAVSPTEPVALSAEATRGITVPANSAKVSLILIDRMGRVLGELSRSDIRK